jgi:hypothetical protein
MCAPCNYFVVLVVVHAGFEIPALPLPDSSLRFQRGGQEMPPVVNNQPSVSLYPCVVLECHCNLATAKVPEWAVAGEMACRQRCVPFVVDVKWIVGTKNVRVNILIDHYENGRPTYSPGQFATRESKPSVVTTL